MPRTPKPLPLSRVSPGDLFALPLEDGRWCTVLILKKTTEPLEVLVQTCAWIGETLPENLDDPRLVAPLILTHHSWKGAPEVHWVTDPVPLDAVHLGEVPLSPDIPTDRSAWGSWGGCRLHPLYQWRWDHEREAVLAEDQVKEEKSQARRHEAKYGYRGTPALTLQELRGQTPFASWTGYRTAAENRVARRTVRDLLDELLALNRSNDEVEKLDALRCAVERFNHIGVYIDTLDREHICDLFEQIAVAAGLTDYDVTEWREW